MKLATSLLRNATYAVFTLHVVLKHVYCKHVKQTTFPVNRPNLCSFINYDCRNQVLKFQSIASTRIIYQLFTEVEVNIHHFHRH